MAKVLKAEVFNSGDYIILLILHLFMVLYLYMFGLKIAKHT